MSEIVIQAREARISEYLSVKRILPFRQRRMVGPFVFIDHAGPVHEFPQEIAKMDVLPHPHIGLSTVSYLFNGKITHRDSLGVEQVILPGEVNWMTAGKGISHSERFEDAAFLQKNSLELIQTWVALPEESEETEPTFVNYKSDQLPVLNDNGVSMRVLAGQVYGITSDVKTLSPLFYAHLKFAHKAKLNLPTGYTERALYVARGGVEVKGQSYSKGQLIVFSKTDNPDIIATEETECMLLGGEPLGQRFIWWNFVSSRKERIEQAKHDWKNGNIILPPNDQNEFIPLPEI